MSDRVRGKFVVTGLTYENWMQPGGRKVRLGAVSASDAEKSENNMYHTATPTGEVTMTVDNPAAAAFFELNRTVYVDFSPAPRE